MNDLLTADCRKLIAKNSSIEKRELSVWLAPIAAASFCGTKCSKRYSGKRDRI